MKRLLTFGLVGIANTLVDVALFTTLHAAGVGLLLSNITSTSVALCLSFLLNRRFTFPTDHVTPRRIVFYFAITLSGLWLLAPVVISLLMWLDETVHYTAPLIALLGYADMIQTVIPKLGSIVVTLTWNYWWYSRVVFAGRPNNINDRA